MGLDNVEFRNSISVEDYNRLRKSAGWKEIEPNQARGSIENSAFLVSVIIDGETVGMAECLRRRPCRGYFRYRCPAAVSA